MRIARSLAAAASAGVILVFVACGEDPSGPPLIGFAPDAPSSTTGEAGCLKAPLMPLDPATLPACCTTGPAHCVPTDNVDPSLSKQLAP
ncbi:MAG: hypothetical protein QOI41_1891 [Myxococcales bacterium]|nr:hypothetical protein [Myxococcales bacterium]